ncbi:GGDEF domain-containing protein [Photobacterium swingsii]|uniref:GGDEF domain-containing protein n=1 Tax=Photobacterium swingsii TaxID=680026 RepID=UPI003D125A24
MRKLLLAVLAASFIYLTFAVFNAIRLEEQVKEAQFTGYVDETRASYWASWQFIKEVYKVESGLQNALLQDKAFPIALTGGTDFIYVTYEFLTTSPHVFKGLRDKAKSELNDDILYLEDVYLTAQTSGNPKDIDAIFDALTRIQKSYERVVHFQLKGSQFNEFLSERKDGDERTILFNYIVALASFLLITALTFTLINLKKTRQISQTDTLTGLANRKYCAERVDKAIKAKKNLCCFFMDMNGFKAVNDTLGHDAGDQLLKVIAKRISLNVKKKDICSRIGGDEFLVVIEDITKDTANKVAQRVIDAVHKPIEIEGEMVEVGLSIGIAFTGASITDTDELVSAADAAMYAAKSEKQFHRSAFVHYQAPKSR